MSTTHVAPGAQAGHAAKARPVSSTTKRVLIAAGVAAYLGATAAATVYGSAALVLVSRSVAMLSRPLSSRARPMEPMGQRRPSRSSSSQANRASSVPPRGICRAKGRPAVGMARAPWARQVR